MPATLADRVTDYIHTLASALGEFENIVERVGADGHMYITTEPCSFHWY